MAPQDKAHELMLAKQRIQVLELTVQILELAKMNQRSTPYTYPPSYPSITYGTGISYTTGSTSG